MGYTSGELSRGSVKHALVTHDRRSKEQTLQKYTPADTSDFALVKPYSLPQTCTSGHDDVKSTDWFSYEHESSLIHNLVTVQALTRSQAQPATSTAAPTISDRRGVNLNLPAFDDLVKSPMAQTVEPSTTTCDTGESDESSSTEALTRISSLPVTTQSSSLGPLTPPLDVDLTSWLSQAPRSRPASRSVNSNSTEPSKPAPNLEIGNSSHRPIPDAPATEWSTLNFAGTPWFQKVLGAACDTLDSNAMNHSVKVISQILPMNATDERMVKTYEMICDRIQQVSSGPRSITITHARKISPGQVVEDFPKSPPATPYHVSGDGYFGDQTIFTHVAEVPVHHNLPNTSSTLEVTAQRHIMTAEASNIILERYIPPTTTGETLDLFDANSCRSYLADRLPELAPNVGSLIFIYPTKTGAQTFAQRYVGPVLDPLLREMSILRGLNTNAAERLGRMKSIESMFEFADMERKLRCLCDALNSRITFQRTRNEFSIEHSDTARVVLDRKTWMTWFVEQEQQRMKQDLIEYHHEGGKLPDTESRNTEITAGMLSREVTDGLRKSTKMAGDVGIEVGVFVIRRHRRKVES